MDKIDIDADTIALLKTKAALAGIVRIQRSTLLALLTEVEQLRKTKANNVVVTDAWKKACADVEAIEEALTESDDVGQMFAEWWTRAKLQRNAERDNLHALALDWLELTKGESDENTPDTPSE